MLDAIKDGFVSGTMAQNPYGQGYVGAYVLDLLASGACTVKADAPWVKTPQTARFINSGTLVINTANLTSYKDDLKKDHRGHPEQVQGDLPDLQVVAAAPRKSEERRPSSWACPRKVPSGMRFVRDRTEFRYERALFPRLSVDCQHDRRCD